MEREIPTQFKDHNNRQWKVISEPIFVYIDIGVKRPYRLCELVEGDRKLYAQIPEYRIIDFTNGEAKATTI